MRWCGSHPSSEDDLRDLPTHLDLDLPPPSDLLDMGLGWKSLYGGEKKPGAVQLDVKKHSRQLFEEGMDAESKPWWTTRTFWHGAAAFVRECVSKQETQPFRERKALAKVFRAHVEFARQQGEQESPNNAVLGQTFPHTAGVTTSWARTKYFEERLCSGSTSPHADGKLVPSLGRVLDTFDRFPNLLYLKEGRSLFFWLMLEGGGKELLDSLRMEPRLARRLAQFIVEEVQKTRRRSRSVAPRPAKLRRVKPKLAI